MSFISGYVQTVHEGFVLFVFWFVVNRHRLPHFLRRFSPLQSESPEQTALIFAVFPRTSKSFNICQRCCLTNWAIADIWQDAIECPQPDNNGKHSKWINLFASLLRSLFAGPRFSPHVQAAYCSNTFHSDCLANHSLSTKIRNSFALKFTNSKTKMASYDQAMCEVAHYFVFLLSTTIRRMRFEQ